MVDFTANQLNIPPQIQYLGDRVEAAKLRRFAERQLTELHRQLQFQDLFQGARRVRDDYGREILVTVTGTMSSIRISVPPWLPPLGEPEPKWEIECFCNCCFAEALILKRYKPYDYFGPIEKFNVTYPLYCAYQDPYIVWYSGTKYSVMVCQKMPMGDGTVRSYRSNFMATALGFTNYMEGDNVIVMFRGHWKGSVLDMSRCNACKQCYDACAATKPPLNTPLDADGCFTIVPFEIPGLTSYVERPEYSPT